MSKHARIRREREERAQAEPQEKRLLRERGARKRAAARRLAGFPGTSIWTRRTIRMIKRTARFGRDQ